MALALAPLCSGMAWPPSASTWCFCTQLISGLQWQYWRDILLHHCLNLKVSFQSLFPTGLHSNQFMHHSRIKQTSFRRVTLYLLDPPLFFPLHCCFCPVVGGVEIHRLVLPVISTVDLWTILSTYMDDNMIKSEVRRTKAPHLWTRRVAGLCWQSVRRCRAELLQHPGWWRIITRTRTRGAVRCILCTVLCALPR